MHLSLFVLQSLGDLGGVENGKGLGWKGHTVSMFFVKYLKEFARSLDSHSVPFLETVFLGGVRAGNDWMEALNRGS